MQNLPETREGTGEEGQPRLNHLQEMDARRMHHAAPREPRDSEVLHGHGEGPWPPFL